MADQWPRQPREGCTPNLARLVFDQTGIDHYAVQVQDHSTSCVSTGWFEVASFRDRPRAKAVRDALNELFAQPGADLDFVHPTRLHAGSSAVVWTKARWSRTHDVWTKVGQCSDTAPDVKTFERLYATEPLVLAKVEAADVHWYEKPSWEIAL